MSCSWLSLSRHHSEVSPPVLCPALFIMLFAEALFFSIADRRYPVLGGAKDCQVFLDHLRPFLTQGQIILTGAALIGISLDAYNRRAIPLNPLRILLQGIHIPLFEDRHIEIKKDILQLPCLQSSCQGRLLFILSRN